jgi:hypothetical protein
VCSDKAKAARVAGTPLPVANFSDGVFTLGAAPVAQPLGGPR